MSHRLRSRSRVENSSQVHRFIAPNVVGLRTLSRHILASIAKRNYGRWQEASRKRTSTGPDGLGEALEVDEVHRLGRRCRLFGAVVHTLAEATLTGHS